MRGGLSVLQTSQQRQPYKHMSFYTETFSRKHNGLLQEVCSVVNPEEGIMATTIFEKKFSLI